MMRTARKTVFSRSQLLVAAVEAALVGLLGGTGCGDPSVGKGFSDRFERSELGPNYRDTIGRWVVYSGRLNVMGAYNHPLWLKRRLPRNVVIEFDAASYTPDGDIKVELYGDGRSFVDHRGAYRSTGYVVCFGGWKNTKSFITRQLEHPPRGKEREFMVTRVDTKVVPGRMYHFKIVRDGAELRWDLDGKPFLSFVDRRPLKGPGHDHFGFNNWESEVSFDNLTIRPLR